MYHGGISRDSKKYSLIEIINNLKKIVYDTESTMAPITRSQTIGRWIRSVIEEPVVASHILSFLGPDDIKSARFVFSGRFLEASYPFCLQNAENIMSARFEYMSKTTEDFIRMGPMYDSLSPVIAYLDAMEPYYDYIHIMGLMFMRQLLSTLHRLAAAGSSVEPEYSHVLLEHARVIEMQITFAKKYSE